MNIILNVDEIGRVMGKQCEKYLKEHPTSQTFFGINLHTNQQKVMSLIQEIDIFIKGDVTSENFIKHIYKNYVRDKSGDLSDSLANALKSCLGQKPFNDAYNRISSMSFIAGANVPALAITRAVLDSMMPNADAANKCVVM